MSKPLVDDSSYTENVSTSRFWFNYRHTSNALTVYNSAKKLGLPDDHIILMLADDIPCNVRNKEPGSIFFHHNRKIDVYGGSNPQIDYRGDQVNVVSLLEVLMGKHSKETPISKRLLSNSKSNVLIYLTGHGGDGFLKFQDSEEISSRELAKTIQFMYEFGRYGSMLLIIDTCQAESMISSIKAPNFIGIASSLVGESSYSHHVDSILGVPVIDRFTYHLMTYFEENIENGTILTATIRNLLKSWENINLHSTPILLSTNIEKNIDQMNLIDFFTQTPQLRRLMRSETAFKFNLSFLDSYPQSPISTTPTNTLFSINIYNIKQKHKNNNQSLSYVLIFILFIALLILECLRRTNKIRK